MKHNTARAPADQAHKINRITFRVTADQFRRITTMPRMERRRLPEEFRRLLAAALDLRAPNGKAIKPTKSKK